KVVGVNSFMITPENDDKGVSMFNAHARVDRQSAAPVHTWLAKIARPTTAQQEGRNTENVSRAKEPAELKDCRYCHMVLELNDSLRKRDKLGRNRAKSEWSILYQVNAVLRAAGYKNWIYKNSVEISAKHRKVWLNVKLIPGGDATRAIEQN